LGPLDVLGTPLEFLAYGGQCQDYAIAKYVALRQAGVPADQMRIVILRATARGEDHAVLVVNVDGEAMMLDNLRTGVVPANSEASYRPYYSINESGWWQHKAPGLTQTALR
jgi:predicted transglutaminase-like cysteine proteinase